MASAMLRRLEDGLELLVRAGLTPDKAADAFNACSNSTRGFVLLEHGLDESDRPSLWDPDPDELPTLKQGFRPGQGDVPR
jgi:hypothetical protein